jgi:opacity protein-like surface antigen
MEHFPITKRSLLYVAVVLLFSTSLQAQDSWKHFTFDAGGGVSFPVGQLSNHAHTGFEFVASGGPRFNESFSLGLDFSLHYFNVKNSLINPTTGIDLSLGSQVRVWSLTLNPTYQFMRREKYTTYATAGYGVYNRHLETPVPDRLGGAACDQFWNVCVSSTPAGSSFSGNFSTYKAGYNVGGGANFGTHTKLFVEIRYHHMFTTNSPTEIIPLTFGVRW